MENLAIENLAVNFASNLGTLALALGLIIIWKRCNRCQSDCHTEWFDCTTPAIQERQVKLYKRAMNEFRRETQRETIKENERLEAHSNGTRDGEDSIELRVDQPGDESDQSQPITPRRKKVRKVRTSSV